MAWNDSIVTNAGTVLLNESLAGRTLSITSAVGGTGTVESTQLVTTTKLSDQKQELTLLGIETVKVESEGGEKEGVKVKIQITNKGLQEGYQLQQVAVLARLNGEETDTMLFIMQDKKGIFIPSISDTPEFLLEIYAIITMTNDADIQIIVDSSAAVSENYMRESLNNAVEVHDKNPDAHKATLKKIKDTLAKKQDITPAVPFSILTTGWQTDGSVPQYPNCYDVTVEDLKETDIVSVVVAPESASVVQTANFAPVTQSYVGKFRLRAAAVPSGTITAQYQIVSTVAKEVP